MKKIVTLVLTVCMLSSLLSFVPGYATDTLVETFASATLDSKWTLGDAKWEMPPVDMEVSHSEDGTGALKIQAAGAIQQDIGEGKSIEIWFLDNRAGSGGNIGIVQYSNLRIGAYPDKAYYSVRSGNDWKPTPVARTNGWHQIIIDDTDTVTRAWIDGVKVFPWTDLPAVEKGNTLFKVGNQWNGQSYPVYFDDLRVSDVPYIDEAPLLAAIEEAKTYQEKNYTKESWDEFSAEIANLESLQAAPQKTNAQIEEALQVYEDAKADLCDTFVVNGVAYEKAFEDSFTIEGADKTNDQLKEEWNAYNISQEAAYVTEGKATLIWSTRNAIGTKQKYGSVPYKMTAYIKTPSAGHFNNVGIRQAGNYPSFDNVGDDSNTATRVPRGPGISIVPYSGMTGEGQILVVFAKDNQKNTEHAIYKLPLPTGVSFADRETTLAIEDDGPEIRIYGGDGAYYNSFIGKIVLEKADAADEAYNIATVFDKDGNMVGEKNTTAVNVPMEGTIGFAQRASNKFTINTFRVYTKPQFSIIEVEDVVLAPEDGTLTEAVKTAVAAAGVTENVTVSYAAPSLAGASIDENGALSVPDSFLGYYEEEVAFEAKAEGVTVAAGRAQVTYEKNTVALNDSAIQYDPEWTVTSESASISEAGAASFTFYAKQGTGIAVSATAGLGYGRVIIEIKDSAGQVVATDKLDAFFPLKGITRQVMVSNVAGTGETLEVTPYQFTEAGQYTMTIRVQGSGYTEESTACTITGIYLNQ